MLAIFISFIVRWRDYHGRTSRREFWTICSAVVFGGALAGLLLKRTTFGVLQYQYTLQVMSILVLLAVFSLPLLALMIRRLHDVNRSGNHVFVLVFLPSLAYLFVRYFWDILGMAIAVPAACHLVYILLLLCKPGDPEPNHYGLPSTVGTNLVGFPELNHHFEDIARDGSQQDR